MRQRFYIASGFALLWMLTSATTIAWTLSMEKMIKPGDSVTIHCVDPMVEPDVVECETGVLSVSPGGCEIGN